jgi:hypothetical protein
MAPAALRVLPRHWCRRHHPRHSTFDRIKAVICTVEERGGAAA